MKDQVAILKRALSLHLDVSDVDAQACYLQLSEAERAEVLRWVHLQAEGQSVPVEGADAPVPVDHALATAKIRGIWEARASRSQEQAADPSALLA